MKHAAVITAGGRVDGAFARALGTGVKALAPFGGSTLLERTITAAREIGIERIALIGGAEVRDACGHLVERIVDESPSGAENLLSALHAWDDDPPLLYLTSDMPFVSGDALSAFISASAEDALAMPLTEWADFALRFPDAPPFGVTLAGERVVNGGAFLIPAGASQAIETFAVKFFDARKSVWKMARLTGPSLLLQFAFRRLGIAQLEAHAGRLLGIRAQAVRHAPAELAYDIDVYEEYRYALTRA
jgi:GTP:adenosylcobinamide-phosphate guanylyltransferase